MGNVVSFQVSVSDLTPTFGPALGAQLLDIFIRDPAVGSFSTAAPHPLRNFTIANDSAWSSRIEIQGFATPVFVDVRGREVGTVDVVADQKTRTIQVNVQKSDLGQPGRGWVFTVTLAGQDGFSPDQARGFAAAPQPYLFGVCAVDLTAPICRLSAATVPKLMDVITPRRVRQADELDPTRGRVSLQGVTAP